LIIASSKRSRWVFLGAFPDALSRCLGERGGLTVAVLRADGDISDHQEHTPLDASQTVAFHGPKL